MGETFTKRPGFMLYFETAETLKEMDDDEAGQFIKAMIDYAKDGVEPDLSSNKALKYMWPQVRNRLDIDAEKYSDRCHENKVKREYQKFIQPYKQNGKSYPSYGEFKAQYEADNLEGIKRVYDSWQ